MRENSCHINDLVTRFAAQLTRGEGGPGTGIQLGAIRTPDDLVEAGDLADRGFWQVVTHPELGRSFPYPGPPGICNGPPWRISRRPLLVGEHNEEVFCEELGLERTDLAYLAEAGVV